MFRRQLEKTFCWKISSELKLFKYRMLKKKKEEIFQSAYQIDSMVCIYELLVEMSGRISEEALKAGIAFPGILPYFYDRWLTYEDSHTEEIQCCIDEEFMKLQEHYREKRLKEGRGEAA